MAGISGKSSLFWALSTLGISLAPAAATAATGEGEGEHASEFDLELTLAAVSDYRFRGLSLSDKDPAFQPQLALTHESGLYARVWGSNLADNGGDDLELDFVAGIARDIGNVSFDLGATYYVYPGAGGLNYVEFAGAVSTAVGPGKVGVTIAYAPDQWNIGGQDNIYAAINASVPLGKSPFSLAGSFGIEDGAFGNSKKDWSIGLTADVKGFTLGAAYVDTAHAREFGRLGKAGVVFSLSRVF